MWFMLQTRISQAINATNKKLMALLCLLSFLTRNKLWIVNKAIAGARKRVLPTIHIAFLVKLAEVLAQKMTIFINNLDDDNREDTVDTYFIDIVESVDTYFSEKFLIRYGKYDPVFADQSNQIAHSAR